jgi:hypothetical protein
MLEKWGVGRGEWKNAAKGSKTVHGKWGGGQSMWLLFVASVQLILIHHISCCRYIKQK